MENKTAEERLRDLIDKHLEFKSGLETTSIQYYAEYGKVSGSMYLNVKRLCEEYASQQLAEKDKEIERLKSVLNKLPDLLHDSLGNRECEYTIKDLPENSCVDSGEFWITHNEVGSGEPLKQWIKSEIDKSLNK